MATTVFYGTSLQRESQKESHRDEVYRGIYWTIGASIVVIMALAILGFNVRRSSGPLLENLENRDQTTVTNSNVMSSK